MSGRGSSAGFRRTYLVGSARSVFSHRSMRISYDDSRGSTAAETARCIRRAREKKAARPNNDPPTKVRTMIDCSICMWIFWAESVQDAKIANGNRATEPQAKRSTPCCTSFLRSVLKTFGVGPSALSFHSSQNVFRRNLSRRAILRKPSPAAITTKTLHLPYSLQPQLQFSFASVFPVYIQRQRLGRVAYCCSP